MTRGIPIVLVAGLLCATGLALDWLYSAPGFAIAQEHADRTGARQPQITAPPSTATVARTDSAFAFVPLDDRNVLGRRLEENAARPLSAYLSVGAGEFWGVERYEMSKFECVLAGADAGVTLGLIAGALGMTAGLWDERTAWYIAGAAAALGAFRGASKADDPAFRVRLRWEDEGRGP